jgi:methyl-accepting chemotaxis protein
MQFLKKISIKTLLTGGTLVVVLTIVMASVLAYRSILPIIDHWRGYQTDIDQRYQLLLQIKSNMGYGGSIHHFKNYLLRGEEKYYENFHEAYNKNKESIEEYLNLPGLDQVERRSLSEIMRVANQYRTNIEKVKQYLGENRTEAYIDGQVKIDDQPALDAFKELEADIEQLARIKTEGLTNHIGSSWYTILILSVIVTLLLGASSIFIGFYITRRINFLSNSIKLASENNNLATRLPNDGKDEISKLSQSFNRFLDKIENLVAEVGGSVVSVNSLSRQQSVKTENTMLSIKATNEEVLAVVDNMKQITASLEDIENKVIEASHNASEANRDVEDSSETMEKTIHSTDRLQQGIDSTVKEINRLNLESDEIVSVLSVISDISDQTNLLALNAAIEAARAGEHGRGFAVVADQVRTLASKTKGATDQINQMIERLQSQVKSSVELMQKTEEDVATSTSLARETREQLNHVVVKIKSINEMTAKISENIKSQNHAILDVHRNLVNMGSTADTTVMLAEENLKGSKKILLKMAVVANQTDQFSSELIDSKKTESLRKLEASEAQVDDILF